MLSLHLPLANVFMAAAVPSLIGSAAIFLMGRTQAPVNAKDALGVLTS
jgi:hypothetical protein